MKRILFFHPDLRGGGAEKVLVDLVNNLDPRKYDISLYTIFEEGVNRKNLKPHVKQKFWFRKVFRGYSVVQRFFSPAFLFRFFVKEEFDIVVAYLEGVPTRIIGGCQRKQATKIAWLHTKLSEAPLQRVFRGKAEMLALYNGYQHIVCVSDVARTTLLEYLPVNPNRVSVIYNTLDVDAVLRRGAEGQSMFAPQPDVVTLCTVGRLTEVKGYERLLKVLAQLKSEDFPFRMFFVGDGHLLPHLQAFVNANDLQNSVSFLGFSENPYPFVKASDLFVCSSFTEGYSTAVTEAILLEVPVITTLCPGMNEILGNGEYGLIVENSEAGLYEGLRNLLSDRSLIGHFKHKAGDRRIQFMEKGKCEDVEALFDAI